MTDYNKLEVVDALSHLTAWSLQLHTRRLASQEKTWEPTNVDEIQHKRSDPES
jgi:hypothetical protein